MVNASIFKLWIFILSSSISAIAFSYKRDRKPGDERKFEATHFLKLTNQPNTNEKKYLRSGTVLGAREFDDMSTLTFELATGSPFGHVGILISMADFIQITKRFEDNYALLHEKAYMPYFEWKAALKGQALADNLSLNEGLPDDLTEHLLDSQGFLGRGDNEKSLLKFMDQLSEIQRQIDAGKGSSYHDHWVHRTQITKDEKPLLDHAIILEMAPGEPAIKMSTTREFVKSSNDAPYGEMSPSFKKAIRSGNTSIIEPKKDLTLDEIERILWYAFYLFSSDAKYNYSQSDAGLQKQNCSEFVCRAFEEVGIEVGHKQKMNSLNLNALGGGLKAGMTLTGKYNPNKVVITPKSVMQSGVEHDDPVPFSNIGLRRNFMHVVVEFDRLNISTTLSDQQIWNEWEKAKRIHWTFYFAKNIFGTLGRPLSDTTFESHSHDGLNREIRANWSNAQIVSISLGIVAAISTVKYVFWDKNKKNLRI